VSTRAGTLGQPRIMVLAAMIAAGFILFFPARQFFEQRAHISSLEHKLAQLDSDNATLNSQSKRLSDPSELEALARQRLGLVRPGEKAYFVEPVKPTVTTTSHKEVKPSWFQRMWDGFTSLVRGRD
jgi:cell division protein FtsB